MSRKNIFIIGAAAIAVVVIAAMIFGFPPASDDVVGTIGAAPGPNAIEGVEQADRYRTSQFTEADLSLEDPEIQVLLQDDEVLEVLQSAEFRRAIENDDLRRALAEPEFSRALMNDERLVNALSRITLKRTEQRHVEFGRVELERTMGADLARDVAKNERLARSLAENEELARAIAANGDLAREVGRNERLQDLFSNRVALGLLASPEMQRIVMHPKFFRITNSPLMRALNNPEFQRRLIAGMGREQQSRGDIQ